MPNRAVYHRPGATGVSGAVKSGTVPAPRRNWAYFLDVDGTLIDIADRPDEVQVDDALLGLVARLHHACGGALALVSGRSLADLDGLLGSEIGRAHV